MLNKTPLTLAEAEKMAVDKESAKFSQAAMYVWAVNLGQQD